MNPGRARAAGQGRKLEDKVAELAVSLGLKVKRQFRVGRRIWGAERNIDLIIDNEGGKRLGIECKFQGTAGTAEEKIPAIIDDIGAWPIEGIVVFEGDGFSTNMRAFLISTGRAIPFEDLESWLRLYFGLDLA